MTTLTSCSPLGTLFSRSYSGKIQIWEFTEKGNKTTESVVFPQFKNEIIPKEKDDKSQATGEEIYSMACIFHSTTSRATMLYAGGSLGKIYAMEIHKAGNTTVNGVMKV